MRKCASMHIAKIGAWPALVYACRLQYGSNATLFLSDVEMFPSLQVLCCLPTLVAAPHLLVGQRSTKVPQLKIEGRHFAFLDAQYSTQLEMVEMTKAWSKNYLNGWKQWWNYLAFQHGGIFVLGTRYRVRMVLQLGWGKVGVGVVVEVCARGIARFLGGVALGQSGYYGPLLTLTNHQCQFRPLHVTWYYCSMWRKKVDPTWPCPYLRLHGFTVPWSYHTTGSRAITTTRKNAAQKV